MVIYVDFRTGRVMTQPMLSTGLQPRKERVNDLSPQMRAWLARRDRARL